MEEKEVLIDNILKQINEIKLEILEKMERVDELKEILNNLDNK